MMNDLDDTELDDVEATRPDDAFESLLRRVAEAPRPPQKLQLEGKSVGHFNVDALIGRGGMGEVWRATDTRLQRRVALKLLFPKSGVRLLDEARAAAAVQNARIATVYEVGSAKVGERDLDFIALEYVAGETLRRRLKRGALPIRDVIAIAADCAEGLAAVHKKGFVHRDIKPDNLAFDEHGRTKLLDFGIAALAGEDPGTYGTLRYMPPEQRRGDPVDARADIYALGVTLIELATGTPPFDDDGKPTAVRPPVAANGFMSLLARCIESDPQKRPADGAEFAKALVPLLTPPSSEWGARVAIVTTAIALAVGGLSFIPTFEDRVVGDLPPALASAPDVSNDPRVRSRFRAAADATLAGDGATAAAILVEVVRAEPDSAWAWALLAHSGESLRAGVKRTEAIARAKSTLRPDDGPALAALIKLMEAQGLDGIAAEHPDVAPALEALRASTDSLFSMALLANAIPWSASVDEKIGRLDAVIARDPLVALAWIARADALTAAGRADEGLQSANDGLSRVPGNTALENALLRAMIARNALDGAEQRARELVRARPDDVAARAALVEIARRRNDAASARAQVLLLLDGPFSRSAAGKIGARVAKDLDDPALLTKSIEALKEAGELEACLELTPDCGG